MSDGEERREGWITGIGLLSSLGEGLDANWDALAQKRVNVDTKGFAPYVVHPLASVNFDAQIPKKGDQRQMEAWQRIGVYTAGLALDSAGVNGDGTILSRMDLIVAAAGGERDLMVDSAILTSERRDGERRGFLNERLMNDLRPTLFLAQLSNLLAGNIAIVHGVTGSSRTFMGEEAAGFDAVRIALARIASGQSDIALVGAAQNGERKDMLMLYEFGAFNLKHEHAPVWQRGQRPGLALGSAGAFLVIESADHARKRGKTPFARLTNVVTDRSPRRTPGDTTRTLQKLWERLAPDEADAIVTGATGAEPATSEECAFLSGHHGVAVRATGTSFGHTTETQFPLGVALAALSVARGALFPGHDGRGMEHDIGTKPHRIVVTGVGHWRGEGMALIEAVT